ncbi:MAG TPA: phosphatase PAP2 family protein [Solirubrobacteraceae bacterium]
MSSAVSLNRSGDAAAAAPAGVSPATSVVVGGRVSAGARADVNAHGADAARPPARARWWVELLAIGWLLWLYDATTNLAPLRLSTALGNARELLHVERVLHIAPELSLDRWLAGHHTLALILSDYYDNAHFVVTLSLLGYLWWRRADIYRPLRNSLVLVNVIGFVVFWRFPVAPPRMLDGFTDVVAKTGAFGSWHSGSLAAHANQVAAMPSLHMAWAGWCTVAVWRISSRRSVRALAVVYPCLTAFAVLATGNHFVLDILAGLLVLAISVWIGDAPSRLVPRRLASAIPRRRSRQRPAQPALLMSQSCYEVQDTVD